MRRGYLKPKAASGFMKGDAVLLPMYSRDVGGVSVGGGGVGAGDSSGAGGETPRKGPRVPRAAFAAVKSVVPDAPDGEVASFFRRYAVRAGRRDAVDSVYGGGKARYAVPASELEADFILASGRDPRFADVVRQYFANAAAPKKYFLLRVGKTGVPATKTFADDLAYRSYAEDVFFGKIGDVRYFPHLSGFVFVEADAESTVKAVVSTMHGKYTRPFVGEVDRSVVEDAKRTAANLTEASVRKDSVVRFGPGTELAGLSGVVVSVKDDPSRPGTKLYRVRVLGDKKHPENEYRVVAVASTGVVPLNKRDTIRAINAHAKYGERGTARKPIRRCTVCDYVHEGVSAPGTCPSCGSPAEAFEKIERRPRRPRA